MEHNIYCQNPYVHNKIYMYYSFLVLLLIIMYFFIINIDSVKHVDIQIWYLVADDVCKALNITSHSHGCKVTASSGYQSIEKENLFVHLENKIDIYNIDRYICCISLTYALLKK